MAQKLFCIENIRKGRSVNFMVIQLACAHLCLTLCGFKLHVPTSVQLYIDSTCVCSPLSNFISIQLVCAHPLSNFISIQLVCATSVHMTIQHVCAHLCPTFITIQLVCDHLFPTLRRSNLRVPISVQLLFNVRP